MLGTVTNVGDRQLSVQLDADDSGQGCSLTFSPQQFPSIDHGFAVSIHRSQGCTVDKSYVLSSRTMDKNLTRPSVGCNELMGLFGEGADQLCGQGGDTIFNLLTIDPLAAQKEAARQRERARLARIAKLAPSRCSCAAKLVGADRVRWGFYAGSARLIGGSDDLLADLTQALHSPACDFRGED